jgi:hypothetical protein
MSIGGGRENNDWQYLDEQECFALWNALSSLAKTRRMLIERGYKNPKTEKPPTIMAIRVAALRYIAKNPQAARSEIIQAGGVWAKNTVAYYQWIDQEVAKKILSDSRYVEWLEENKELIGTA